MSHRTYLVAGASRGIGAAVAQWLVDDGACVYAISRSPAVAGRWIQANLATDEGTAAVLEAVGNTPLDGLLFMGGTWEEGAFNDAYDFALSPVAETRGVIAVNLIAPILLAQGLAPNLRQSDDPRIILMGALSGLDNAATPEVANTASKFGLRGAAQALAQVFARDRLGVTVINPGNVETPEVLEDIATGAFAAQKAIPVSDVLATVAYVLQLSRHSTPREINLAQRHPG